jgi:radical SAM protein with 4Fe4S-binding SPASM domain
MSARRPAPGLQRPPQLRMRGDSTRQADPASLLQRISIEISRVCNLRCTYCYADAGEHRQGGLSDSELRFIIQEAVQIGAAAVSIVGGGEPTLRSSLLVDGESCIDFANGLGCYCCLYTNGTLIDERAAEWLAARDVSVVGKLNSLKQDVQDQLAGVAGSASLMRRGIDALLKAGLADGRPSRLGLETIICRQNYDEMPQIWRFMRQRNIVPEVEIPTVHGRARANEPQLCFNQDEAPDKYRELFDELLSIDREEFGCDWTPRPPFAALSCRLYYTNCYINDRGGVQPCAGVDRPYGVLQVGSTKETGTTLAQVVAGEPFQKLRRVHEHLKPPCQGCEWLPECYGCRGAAFNFTGDLFAGDPVCWLARSAPTDCPR